jgi:sulfate adenylyltransferase subunit 1 (EFTu-like GTPase family)
MDLVDYKEENYKKIVTQFESYKRSWGLPNLHYIPISALQGDNVVEQSTKMPWYKNKTLIKTLMDIPSTKNQDQGSFRLPIQYIFPNSQNKIVSGRISSGKLKIGDQLKLMRTGETVIVESILNPTLPVLEGGAGLSVTIHLDSTISINRGDILVHPNSPTKNGNNIESILCWLDANQWDSTKTYILQHQQKEIMARISNILYIQNINHPNIKDLSNHIGMNDIANVTLELKESLYFDSYKENHVTGSFILIDPITNHTVAAGLIQ